MSERITAIEEFEDRKTGEYYGTEAGFDVKTTEQTITLAIDNDASCCESWGYFLTEDDPSKFIGADLRGVKVTDTNRSTKQFAPRFDGDYDNPNKVWLDDGGVLFVDIETDRGPLQFVAYNVHNGYYGHEARIEATQLTHSVIL